MEDPDWAGRWRIWTDLGKPIRILETKDDGQLFAQDPAERAAGLAAYVRHLAEQGGVESVLLFTLPGGMQDANKPTWWFLNDSILRECRAALALQPIVGGADVLPTVALLALWRAAKSGIPFNPDAGIVKLWAEQPFEYGSPVSKELDHPEGGVVQVLTRAAIRWTPDRGAVRVA